VFFLPVVTAQFRPGKFTVLGIAAFQGDAGIVTMLIEAGAKVNYRTTDVKPHTCVTAA
jgi:hypothetical protein